MANIKHIAEILGFERITHLIVDGEPMYVGYGGKDQYGNKRTKGVFVAWSRTELNDLVRRCDDV